MVNPCCAVLQDRFPHVVYASDVLLYRGSTIDYILGKGNIETPPRWRNVFERLNGYT